MISPAVQLNGEPFYFAGANFYSAMVTFKPTALLVNFISILFFFLVEVDVKFRSTRLEALQHGNRQQKYSKYATCSPLKRSPSCH